MMTRYEMEEKMEMRFAELMEAEGYEAWWACEDRWDAYEKILKAEGFDAEMVEEFFEEMAWEI